MTHPLTLAEIEEAEQLLEMRESLPHLYGFPWYQWAKDFFDSSDKAAFLVAANQVSKSSTQIRKVIEWATNQSLWQKLWPGLLEGQKPNQFWYFYPTSDIAQSEFETKWVPDFLPRGRYKDDAYYGWYEVKDKGYIKKIVFNSGVTVYFKTYAQKIKDLQTGSVYYLALDEETPVDFIPELQARLRATNGYLSAVFTATLGQEYWRRVMEPVSKEDELYPGAFKRTVSLYDSQSYIDGSLSQWTSSRIAQVIAECTSQNEVQRRVFGRFVKSEGLKLESFDIDKNMCDRVAIPKSWGIFSGVDPGSGGKSGHPAAIYFIAVRPDYRLGYVFRGWRGDGIPTANPDILKQFRVLKGDMLLMSAVYDYKDKDFFLVAQSQGEPFSMAKKERDEGFGLMNSLFKNGMLKIFRGDVELDKLVGECMTLSAKVDKRKALDDAVDAVRYTCMSIPWDFSHIVGDVNLEKFMDAAPDLRSEKQRADEELLKSRREFVLGISKSVDSYSSEIEEWNELSGANE